MAKRRRKALRKNLTKKSDVKKTTRKAFPKKAVSKLVKSNTRKHSKRKTVKPSKGSTRKKYIQKGGSKNKANISKVTKRVSTKTAKKRTTGVLQSKRQRSKEQTNFNFKHVRNIDKKIILFNEQSDKALDKQLKRKGGKPPAGIVVLIEGKALIKEDGKLKKINVSRSFISEPTFVVNKNNIKKFVQKSINDLQKEFKRKMQRTDNGKSLDEDDSFGIFDPNSITGIIIKYIYYKAK